VPNINIVSNECRDIVMQNDNDETKPPPSEAGGYKAISFSAISEIWIYAGVGYGISCFVVLCEIALYYTKQKRDEYRRRRGDFVAQAQVKRFRKEQHISIILNLDENSTLTMDEFQSILLKMHFKHRLTRTRLNSVIETAYL
jgi:hypothetical protein